MQPGEREAVVTIPVGAVTGLSADSAVSLAGDGDSPVESMRLHGDVLIDVAGAEQPIRIKADSVLLELTADTEPGRQPPPRGLRSIATLPGDDDSQVFVGNVVFELPTATGTMEIKANRVEHRLRPEPSRPKAGA
jgi:hypothetical protein